MTDSISPDRPPSLPPAGRPPRLPLLSLDEALQRLMDGVTPLPESESETLSTFDALGRVLAEDLLAQVDVPPADNTSMDGYALRIADLRASDGVLPVGLRVPAGTAPRPLPAGLAARIFTGAQVPLGADAVVMQEQCEALDGGAAVRVLATPAPGQWIRRRGEDVQRGGQVLAAGAVLDAQRLGLAASVGFGLLKVRRRLRVALLSTGDELVMPGSLPPEALPPGAIFNSNRYTLSALIRAMGARCTDLGIVPDLSLIHI